LIAKFESFEVIHANRPAIQPKVVVDSLFDQGTSNADNEASDSDDGNQLAESTTAGNTTDTSNGNITTALNDQDSSDKPAVHVKQKPQESADFKSQVDTKPIISNKKKTKQQTETV